MALPFVTPLNLVGPVGDSITRITDKGAALIARSMVEGIAFKLTHFAIGTGGFNPANPLLPAPIDGAATALMAEYYRAAIDSFDEPVYATKALAIRTGTDGAILDATKFGSQSASFAANDVGRLLVNLGPSQRGVYRIATIVSPTVVALVDMFGNAPTLTPATALSWQVVSGTVRIGIDGSVTAGSGVFGAPTGSFTLADSNRRITIAGVDYIIASFQNDASVILKNLDGSAYSAPATATNLAWSMLESEAIINAVSVYAQPANNALAVTCRVPPQRNLSNYMGELGLFATVLFVGDGPVRGTTGTTALVGPNVTLSDPSANFNAITDPASKTVYLVSGSEVYQYMIVGSTPSLLTLSPVDGSLAPFPAQVGVRWYVSDVRPGDGFLFSLTHFPLMPVFNSAQQLHRVVVAM